MTKMEEPKVFCTKCKHRDVGGSPCCAATLGTKIDYVTGRKHTAGWVPCHNRNHDGDCPRYEPKIGLMQRIKEGLRRKP